MTTIAAPERTTFVRTFAASIASGDGRTIDARIVPFGVPALVADPPDLVPYEESFARGAFERQCSAPDRVRVWLNFEHEDGLRGIVGHGTALAERSDGLYGSFRVHENADGDKALQLVNDGLLTGLSMEFAALRSRRSGGIVERLRAHIDKVSLCRFPAYSTAQVLAIREQPDEPEEPEEPDEPEEPKPDETPAPAEKEPELKMAPDLADRLEALGYEPLSRIAKSSAAWDGSPSRFTDEQYRRSTLFCRPGDAPVKERCSLPVLEPSGALNLNALGAAAAALAGARGGLRNVSTATKAAAARKLIRYYNQAGLEPPESLRRLAASG